MNPLGRLLIVDDEATVLEVLREFFAGQGYEVHTAADGEAALAAARRERPQAVLLDVRMPGMDGVEVLRQLRGLDPRVAVIMVTANEDVSLARETLELGAFDYIAKPFDFGYLERAVAAALAQTAAGPHPAGGEDAWRALAVAVFRAARRMTPVARASTGEPLERAALEAARVAGAGRGAEAASWLDHLDLVLDVAAALGDLPEHDREAIVPALHGARKALAAG